MEDTPKRRALKRASQSEPWGTPVLTYFEGDAYVTHTKAIRMSDPAAEKAAFEVCQTAVPAIVCNCNRYLLVMAKGRRS